MRLRNKTGLITILSTILLGMGEIYAQSHESILKSIEQNNLLLKAYRAETNAEMLENRSGITLPNPEVEFHHLWLPANGNNTRQDISASQSFDIATISGIRRQLAGKSNEILEEEYREERIATLLSAKTLLINLTKTNALIKIMEQRENEARQLAEMYKSGVENGHNTIIEQNKAQINAITINTELQNLKLERQQLLTQLQFMNGGIAIQFNETMFGEQLPPIDFDAWYNQIESQLPLYASAMKSMELSSKQVALSRMEGLPEISAGYMSEGLKKNDKAHGITLGISIPLWANKNNIKQAKAAEQASRLHKESVEQQLYYSLYSQYEKCRTLNKTVVQLRESVNSANHSSQLRKALTAGQISLTDYIVEKEMIYDMFTQLFTLECDYHTALAELRAVEL